MGAQHSPRRQRKVSAARRTGAAATAAEVALSPERAFGLQAPDAPDTDVQTGQSGATNVGDGQAGINTETALSRSMDWLKRRTWDQWAWVAVLVLAAVLRFWDLGAKPLHHDESMHAFYSLLFARDPSSYAYNPLLHGPFQFHAEGFMFMLLLAVERLFGAGGVGNDPWINDATARIVPALFGLGIVTLPLGLRREMSRGGALIAALLLAVSPSFVYFSRFLREDIYFNFFMFAMVVCAVRFATSRRMLWLSLTVAATVLAYATFEGTYLALVIFLSFLGAAAVWELAVSLYGRLPLAVWEPLLPLVEPIKLWVTRGVLLAVVAGLGAIAAVWALQTMRSLNAFITTHPTQSDINVALLEQRTVTFMLYVSIAVALFVIIALVWQIARDNAAYDRDVQVAMLDSQEHDGITPAHSQPPTTRAERIEMFLGAPGHLASRIQETLDPERQPLLRLLLGITWAQWFVAFVTGWMLFVALFWELPGPGRTLGQGFEEGIGHGIWQGLYYWLQQQDVARGAQPIYYYFLLIPLYEQLAVVLGLAGLIYAIARPTYFRIFLVWWFIGSLGIYSWAGEKMPWLSIHILLSLMLLAAIAINRALQGASVYVRALRAGISAFEALNWRSSAALASVALTVLLLIPMVHSMAVLAYQDPANGPLEMMVYVQTAPDVDTVMSKITQADKNLYGGKHHLKLVVGQGEEWPMYWYLRDYWLDPHPGSYVTWDPQAASGSNPFTNMPPPDALILYPGDQVQQFFQAHPTGYHMKEYVLRSWFDESYKPQLACLQHPGLRCPANANYALYGQGLGPWLTYGSAPPANAKFNLSKASARLWNWLWYRRPLGATTGPYYDFVFIVKDSAGVTP